MFYANCALPLLFSKALSFTLSLLTTSLSSPGNAFCVFHHRDDGEEEVAFVSERFRALTSLFAGNGSDKSFFLL